VKPWESRPLEQRTILNPALLSVLVYEAARGYFDERSRSFPYALAFLATPMVIHEPTRESLPTMSTSMYAWLRDQPQARVHVPPLAVQFVDPLREAIRLGARRGLIGFGVNGDINAHSIGRVRPRSQTADIVRCRDKAHFSGRWLARAGDPGTILASWGLAV
jgi:hypothetical protein